MHQEHGTNKTLPDTYPALTEAHETWLISRITEKDRKAFEILYRSYFSRLLRFLSKLTRQNHLIEEVVNDTMMVVWQKAGTFNRSSKVSTWIFSISYRQFLKANGKADESVEANFDEMPDENGSLPEQELDLRQVQKKIIQVLDTLPFEQRSVVILTYYHGMGYEDIAETMSCPVNTVKTRMFHARQKMKKLLSDYQRGAL